MAIKISGNTVVADDESFNIGNFTTATRPASPEVGTLIYNTDNSRYEFYNGSSWDGFLAESALSETSYAQGELLHTLDNPNPYGTSVNDYFGTSVAIDGNYAIVGARLEDDAGGTSSGKAYIFDVTTGLLLYTLDNPTPYGTSQSDNFGGSVAISGDYAIVGARTEDEPGGIGSGKAYIYNVTTGNLVHTLDNPNAYGTSADDYFGESVAISGNYAIVGAGFEDDAGGTRSGKAYIFDVTTGNLIHTLDNPNPYGTSVDDLFAQSVAISGNYAIVGARWEDDAGGSASGKAYIFNVTTGALLYTLDNPNAYSTSENDFFGASVSISGNYAIVGASGEDDASGTTSGKAYIFASQDLSYLETTVDITGTLQAQNLIITDDATAPVKQRFSILSSSTTISAGNQVICTDAITVTLPASPAAGDSVVISNQSTGTVTVGRNGSNIKSTADDGSLAAGISVQLVYVNSTIGWAEI